MQKICRPYLTEVLNKPHILQRIYISMIKLLVSIFAFMSFGFAVADTAPYSNLDEVGANLGTLKYYLDKKVDQNKTGLSRFYDRVGLNSLAILDASDFVRPNERDPQDSIKILRLAPSGIYLSVGSERGFIGTALAQNTSHLLLVDKDPKVYIFNRLNILLLTMAKNLEDYQFLRFHAGHNLIVARARQLNLNFEDIEFLSNVDVFHFLKFLVRNPFFIRPISVWAPFSSIGGSIHYMNNSNHFDKLSKLAKSGRIKSVIGDLSSDVDLKIISDIAEEWGSRVSVLDISNAWVSTYLNKKTNRTVLGYISETNLKRLIQKMFAISSPEAILLLTNLDRKYGLIKQVWNYYGLKLAEAEKYSHTEMWKTFFPGEGNLGFTVKNELNKLAELNSNNATCKDFYGAIQ